MWDDFVRPARGVAVESTSADNGTAAESRHRRAVGTHLTKICKGCLSPWGVLLLSFLVFCPPLHAAPGDFLGAEFQINSYTPNFQRNAVIATQPGGGFVVVWESSGQDGGGYGTFGQRFTTAGAKAGTEFQLSTYTLNNQEAPSIAAQPDGSVVAVWHSFGQDNDGRGIFGQRFNNAGGKTGTEFQLNSFTVGAQAVPSVATRSDGAFVAAWQSAQDGGSYGVFGRRFDSAGVQSGTEFQINSYTTITQGSPIAAALPDGAFVVTWGSFGQDGSSLGTFGQRFNSTGGSAGSEFQINSNTAGNQFGQKVAAQADSSFVVVWISGQDGSAYGVFGQRFGSAGGRIGSEFQINSYTTFVQANPYVAAKSDGSFVVVWHSDQQDGSSFGIFGQHFSSTGARTGTEFRINSYVTNYQQGPAVAAGSDNGFVVAWQSNLQDGSSLGLFGQRFEGDSTATPTPTATQSPIDTATVTNTPTGTPTQTETTTPTNTTTLTNTPTETATTAPTSTTTLTETATTTPTETSSPTRTSTPAAALCAAAPIGGCVTADKAKIKMRKDAADSSKSKLLWKWKGSITAGDLSDPTLTTSYRLCVYGDGALAMSPLLESGTSWTPAGTGFKYTNTATNADGMFKALAKDGSGKAKLLVKGKGTNLSLPLPLTDTTAVTVQLVKNAGSGNECWESVFDAANSSNAADGFKDKLP